MLTFILTKNIWQNPESKKKSNWGVESREWGMENGELLYSCASPNSLIPTLFPNPAL